jgi:hypothetical protein
MDDRAREIAELKARLAALELAPPPDDSPQSAASSKPDQPPSSQNGIAIALGAAMVVVLIVLVAAWNNGRLDYEAEVAAKAPTMVPEATWAYRETTDAMSSAGGQEACINSVNTVRLDWPYEAVTGRLCIMQRPRQGRDVIVALNGDGQILCRSYDGCTVRVRFEDGEVQSFSAVGPSDGSSNIVFIRNDGRMIAAVQAADVTRVELEFYQSGSQTLEFHTRGLVWPRPDP